MTITKHVNNITGLGLSSERFIPILSIGYWYVIPIILTSTPGSRVTPVLARNLVAIAAFFVYTPHVLLTFAINKSLTEQQATSAIIT